MSHTAYAQRLGPNSLRKYFARGKCNCGWQGRLWGASTQSAAAQSAKVEADAHMREACACTNYAGDNGPCAAH
jgi:hypothetical protein